MCPVVAAIERIQNAVITRRIFARHNFPRQKPRAFDAVCVHVGDKIGVAPMMPENVLVRINNAIWCGHDFLNNCQGFWSRELEAGSTPERCALRHSELAKNLVAARAAFGFVPKTWVIATRFFASSE